MVAMKRAGAGLMVALLLAGCSSITNHRGYIVDEVLVSSVQPGLDNRESVEGTLGQPTMKSMYGEPVWYYVASITSQAPFTRPKIREESVLAVRFDEAGNVASVDRWGEEQIAYFDPDKDETDTLGRNTGFLEDLFGNIGTVGAGGLGGQ